MLYLNRHLKMVAILFTQYIMKKILILLSIVFTAFCGFAQQKVINTAIPQYKILKADSTYTTWAQLKKAKPVMIVYFMPDCPHCQQLTVDIEKNMASFKDIQIVLITCTKTEYPYLRILRDFSKRYNLVKYKNITMGTEYPSYKVNDYYDLQTTPFIAIYDRHGKMIKYFDKPTKISDVINTIKKV